jgi:hypothetical protein
MNFHFRDGFRHDNVRDSGWNNHGRSDNLWGKQPYEIQPPPISYDGPMPQVATSSKPKQLGELVTEGPVVFWTPPPIAYGPRPQEAGKRKLRKKSKSKYALWHRFIEVDSTKEPSLCSFVKEGQTVMVLKSQVSEEDAAFESEVETPDREPGRRTFWDRHKHRRLTFIRPINHTMQVHYDYSTFGFPLPEMTFVMGTSKQGFLPVENSSLWAYTQPHPMSEDQVGSKPSLEECRPKPLLPAPQTRPLIPPALLQCKQFLELSDNRHVEEEELVDWDELELLVEQKDDPLPPSAPCEWQTDSEALPRIQEDLMVIDLNTSQNAPFSVSG